MLDKKIVKQFFKYLLMFLLTFMLCHMTNMSMETDKCITVALGSARTCSVLSIFCWHVPSPFRHGQVSQVEHCPALGLLVFVASLCRASCRIVGCRVVGCRARS